MHISRLQLTQFRNYDALALGFSPAINCLVGENGAGKTNVLDALHYLSFTRGFRNTQDQHAIQEGGDFFLNEGQVEKGDLSYQIQCNVVKGKGKKLIVNKDPLKKMSDHIGRIPMVAILPHDTNLIDGPAADRRKFVDQLISQYDPSYLRNLIQYEKILAQRNALLKYFGEHGGFDQEQIGLWDMQLIPNGIAIQEARGKFVEDFLPIFQHYFKAIVSERKNEVPNVRYRPSIKENTEAGWQNQLGAKMEKDRVNGYSSAGSHRDELIFSINHQSVRNFGSQGQQKTFVIALKLAQYQLLEQQARFSPILLLDDIFDKLDENRLQHIAHILDQEIKGQIFITDTSYDRLMIAFSESEQREVRFFSVMDGGVAQM
ncbi:MAG: DNA replication/repair protein RecF [Bacteroidota bacterium]